MHIVLGSCSSMAAASMSENSCGARGRIAIGAHHVRSIRFVEIAAEDEFEPSMRHPPHPRRTRSRAARDNRWGELE
jgi:hypothetical protein